MVPRVLTIAGSDSGGGAGIQADLKTFLALQTFGMSVLTALTAQNTVGVQDVHVPDPAFVKAQFDSIAHDIQIDAVKIGMLARADVVQQVAACLQPWCAAQPRLVILDPVMISTSGSLLLSHDAIDGLIHGLFPLCTLLTPNIGEAEQILQNAQRAPAAQSNGLARMMTMAQQIAQLAVPNVLVKGGHAPIEPQELKSALCELGLDVSLSADAEDSALFTDLAPSLTRDARGTAALSTRLPPNACTYIQSVLGASHHHKTKMDVFVVHGPSDVRILRRNIPEQELQTYTVDVLYESATQHTTLFIKHTVPTSATHGTGCTLASAICALCAHGHPLRVAVAQALQFMQEALQGSIEDLGQGAGPLNHGAHVVPRGIPLCTPRCAAPLSTTLIARSWHLWHKYTRHPFAVRMNEGTLSKAAFVWFMRQDYLYLKHYARVWAAAAANPTCSGNDIRDYLTISRAAIDETEMHKTVCERAGIRRDDLEATEESRATMAYTRYVMDVAQEGILPLLVSVASCAYGYAEVGLWLKEQHQKSGGMNNTIDPSYKYWIEEYGGASFQSAIKSTLDMLERCAARVVPSVEEVDHLQDIWNTYVTPLTQRHPPGNWHVGRSASARRAHKFLVYSSSYVNLMELCQKAAPTGILDQSHHHGNFHAFFCFSLL